MNADGKVIAEETTEPRKKVKLGCKNGKIVFIGSS